MEQSMGDKGGKKNREKSQKQISEKLRRKDTDKLKKQQRGQSGEEIVSDKTAKKKKVMAALNANMKAVNRDFS
jgi:hypothetical protein